MCGIINLRLTDFAISSLISPLAIVINTTDENWRIKRIKGRNQLPFVADSDTARF